MKAIGYHIYAGGFTVGVSRHFKVLMHLEHGNYGARTCKKNFPKLPIFVGENNFPKMVGDIDLLYGNPPCAAFSVIGKHKGVDDVRLSYHRKFQDLVKQYQPTVAVCESVTGILKKGKEIVDEFCEIPDYAFYIVKHDAQYIIGTQERKRVFLIASKVELDFFSIPLVEPIPSGKVLKRIKNAKTIAFGSQEKLYKNLIPLAQPGEHMNEVFNRTVPPKKRKKNNLGVIGRPSFASYRLDPNKVAGAMIGIFRVHPTKDRCIRLEEIKELCTYPQDYQITDVNEISRAVMPGVGEWIAKVVKAGIKRCKLPKKAIETVDVKPKFQD